MASGHVSRRDFWTSFMKQTQIFSVFRRQSCRKDRYLLNFLDISSIGIMQKRYQDQFEVSMDIPEYLRSLEVPKLFLQPFVENAIVHGFKNYQDSGKIWISAEEEENDILFYVEDNGCGICEEDLKEVLNKERKSIGVRNTNKRIRMIYGEKYGVTISSQLEEGTVVTIRLPLKVNSKKQS